MKIETREVLAVAYVQGATNRPMLTHAVLVDKHGNDVDVMCRRVKFENLAGRFACDPNDPVTCKACVVAVKKAASK